MKEGFIVYNNSGRDLVIRLKDGIEQWQAGKLLRIDDDKKERIYWEMHDEMFVPVLYMQSEGKELAYHLAFKGRMIPDGFFQMSPGSWFTPGTREYFFQLEKDKHFYLVMKPEHFPVRILPEQPKGFPITPEN